ncbi:MAG: hypothetical protein IPJ88_07040 [Myxococcales bacterium]|nr:MAG: hypothetical protein IPJ88_07040 [Myxococcales bacterium]
MQSAFLKGVLSPSFIVIAIVLFYMAAMLGMGWYASKKVKGNDDFLVAGRRLGPRMMAAHAKEHGQVVPGPLDEEPGAQLHLWGDDPAETPGPNSWQLCSR